MTTFDEARRLLRRRGGRAHLLVRHRGETVLDERLGVGPEAAFWPFSVSKLWIATLVWALHDDGALDVDDPVADHWPEFGRHGKRATILDVLRHRSGVPRAGSTLAEVAAMTDWRRATAAIAPAPPIRRHDAKPAYEWLAWGFILGEVARRATGLSAEALPGLLRDRILDPLGADGTSLG
ncbi:MAG: beta-lactamase family protein, partial [Microbacteriaceae bacterium]|nr:beta-lactamase family protein [Microbacteriaceae bacterium]